MSGTSADGVDAALVEIAEGASDRPSIRLVRFRYEPFAPALRRRLFALFDPAVSLLETAAMHVLLGRRFGQTAAALLREAGVAPAAVRVIGSHGQTVAHYPAGGPDGGGIPFTVQIGDPASIAEAAGVAVVSDFRSRDLALGGQGAPLVPYFDHALWHSADETRVLLNLGGVANLTVLRAGTGAEAVLAFDTGPGNMVLDAAASLLSRGALDRDEDGAWAARGRVRAELLARWLAHPYLARPAPKSTGRELFGRDYTAARVAEGRALGAPPEDIMATLTALVADSVAEAARAAVGGPFALIAAGGGVHNRTLMDRLAAGLELVRPWRTTDADGVPADAKEAMAFAYLAWQFCQGRPTSLASVTGARRSAPLGVWTPAGAGAARPRPSR